MKDNGKGVIFKEKTIESVTGYKNDTKEKCKATVSGIICAITISSENFINILETGVWCFEGRNSGQK